METKVSVQGTNSWSQASHSVTTSGSFRILKTNDLPDPSMATTGTFPISSSDPAYAYDRNPNSIQVQSFDYAVPKDPVAASTPTCTGGGPIGLAIDGVAFFDALDAVGRDAGAWEVQDSCDGHPQQADIYHYHTFSSCLDKVTTAKGSSTLIGYALDGYGIYVERDASGNFPINADLDSCHGRTSTIDWDGKSVDMYHYDVTIEYPYLIGCFHGTPVSTGPETSNG
jgi:hypothetical protein